MLLVDDRGTIRAIWAADETSLQRPARVLVGERISAVLCGKHYAPLRKLLERVRKTNRVQHLEYPVDFPEGTRWFCARIFPVANHATRSKMLCFFSRDITGRKRTEEALRKNKTLLEQSEKLASLGSWEVGRQNRSHQLVRQRVPAARICSGRNAPRTESACQRMIHPDDRPEAKRSSPKPSPRAVRWNTCIAPFAKTEGFVSSTPGLLPLFSESGRGRSNCRDSRRTSPTESWPKKSSGKAKPCWRRPSNLRS